MSAKVINIIHFIYDDIKNPYLGGGGALVTYRVYSFFPENYKITIITGHYKGAKRIEKIGNITYLRVGYGSNYFLSRLTFMFSAWKYLFSSEADLYVEAVSPYSPIFLPFFLKIKPYMVVFHSIFGKHFLKSKGLIGILPLLVERLYLKKIKYGIAVSKEIKRIIKNHNFSYKLLAVIYNGVEKELFEAVPEEKNYILFLGRIDIYHKGLDLLIKAFEEIGKEFLDVKLIIAGSGKDEERLKKLIGDSEIKNRIEFIGRIEGKNKIEWLRNALFLCMPSRFEALGIVALEASACSKPVIATKVEGLKEIVIHNKNGLLINPNNVPELVKAMKTLLLDKTLREKLGKNGRELAKEFMWENVAKKYQEVYSQLLKIKR